MRTIATIIEDMTSPRRRILVASSLGSIVGAFWMLGHSPLLEQKASVDAEVTALEVEHDRLENAQRSLPLLSAQVTALKEKLRRARNELPNQREIPDLLSSVSDRARDAGLEVNLFRPTEEVFRDFYAEVPVFFSVRGSYHQIARFFDEVGRLDRIVTVSGVSIKASSTSRSIEGLRPAGVSIAQFKGGAAENEGIRQTETGCTVTTFRLLDEEERVQSSVVRTNSKPVTRR